MQLMQKLIKWDVVIYFQCIDYPLQILRNVHKVYNTLPRQHIGMLLISLLYNVLPQVTCYISVIPCLYRKHLSNSCIILCKGTVWRDITTTLLECCALVQVMRGQQDQKSNHLRKCKSKHFLLNITFPLPFSINVTSFSCSSSSIIQFELYIVMIWVPACYILGQKFNLLCMEFCSCITYVPSFLLGQQGLPL